MLSVANLEVVYHSVVLVLKGVSIEVPTGAIVALLGPNGAGKTTTLRAITGLLDIHDGRITRGAITWCGDALVGQPPDAIVARGLAQVMEGRRIFADLTVEENLRAGAVARRGSARSRGAVAEALESQYARFPILAERRSQQAGYLSGGEQQMLAISRALMASPQLLLLDEPSLGLAPKIQREVADLILAINAEGTSVLLVEQNAQLALSLASHGYVMDSGKVVLDGSAEALRSDTDIQEFYLGGQGGGSYRQVKHYRRRKRWLS